LDVVLQIVRREKGIVHGFHAAPSEAELGSDKAQVVPAEFDRRCREAQVSGELSFDVGEVARAIYERSWWVDLIVLSLSYPPAPQPMARLASGFRTILRNCARPVLAVPGAASMPSRALLAYDGSLRADEALFVAAYLAGQWEVSLAVVTAEDGRATAQGLAHAQAYLEAHDVRATYESRSGPAAEAILRAAGERECDWIIMGSYGPNPLVEMVKGSAVDAVLRGSKKPVLICR
jgi:nucleotide-binding universal stress UspA family protein